MKNIFILTATILLIISMASCRKNPEAAFTISNDYPTVGEVVNFTDASQNAAYNSYHWDFGDGGSSQSTNPTHTYEVPGIYTATLEIANKKGKRMSVASEALYVDAFKLGILGTWRYDSVHLYTNNCIGGITDTTYYNRSSTWSFNEDFSFFAIYDYQQGVHHTYDLTDKALYLLSLYGQSVAYQYSIDGQNLHLNKSRDEPCYPDTLNSYVQIDDLYFTKIE